MIQVSNIRKEYRIHAAEKVEALKEVNISLPETGLISIIGKSGSGKTTLLNLLGALDKPSDGSISYLCGDDNTVITDISEGALDEFRNCVLGIVFQGYNLVEHWNVQDNIRIALEQQEWKGKSEAFIDEAIDKALEFVELQGMRSRRIRELSGGQQQRVAIARALVKSPKILLADEPTGNLDYETSRSIMNLLRKCSKNCLVVVVTHDLELAEEYSDRVMKIRDGKVQEDYCIEHSEAEETTSFVMPARENVKKCNLSVKTKIKLAWNAIRVKKLKLLFTMLALIFVLSITKLAFTFGCSNIGKNVARFLQKNDIDFLYTSEKKNFSYEYEDVECRVENRKELKERLDKYFGKESVYPAVRNICVINRDTMAEFYDGVLVVGGLPGTGDSLCGKLPSNSDEVVITDRLAAYLLYEEQPIGKSVFLQGKPMTISGIVQTEYSEHNTGNGSERSIGDKDCRILVSDTYPERILRDGEMEIPFMNLLPDNFFDDLNRRYPVARTNASFEAELLWGRLPQSRGEIVLTLGYGMSNLILSENGEPELESLSFPDIHDKALQNVLSGYLSAKEFIPNPVVVGVINCEDSELCMLLSEQDYDDIAKAFSEEYYAEFYEVFLNGKAKKQSGIYKELYESKVDCEAECLRKIYEKYESIHSFYWLVRIVILSMLILLFILCLLFFTFNVRDNYYQIGILRSIGVSMKDISGIWLIESIMVSGFVAFMSEVVNFIVLAYENRKFRLMQGLQSNMIYQRGDHILLLLGILLFFTVLTVIVPILSVKEKKPVELIRRRVG